jgi:serine/threonine protein kinase
MDRQGRADQPLRRAGRGDHATINQAVESGQRTTIAPGTVLHGNFRVLRLIAGGGMGEIYAATHTRLAGRYAVKVLHAEAIATGSALERFRREAEITSALRHPHIVQVLDFNQMEDGRPYMVMEHLDGTDLRARLQAQRTIPLDRAAAIVEQVSEALAAAHAVGVTHRDLKPENLFCVAVPGSEKEFVKVLDFGMSKIRHAAKITADATVLGTPPYMSPEQAMGRVDAIDPATDQFALAAILYEMLSGEIAFFAPTMTAVLDAVIHKDPPPLVDADLMTVDRILRAALAKDKSQRFPDILAFARAVRAAAR